jgi:hypothetical protein
MKTEKNKTATGRKDAARKPIELKERDLEQVTGGTKVGSSVVEDPCAGGQIRRK